MQRKHDEMQKCMMKCKDAQVWECIVQVWESVVSLAHYCREAVHDMQNCSTHDGNVVL
jgi:hypothetical protein